MLRRIFSFIMIIFYAISCMASLSACYGNDEIIIVPGVESYKDKSAEIVDMGSYFRVTLDYTESISHREMGESYMNCILKVVPDFEKLVDSYLSELINNNEIYSNVLDRAADIRNQIPQEYIDEIEGMASKLSGTTDSLRCDDKLSVEELYMFNLVPDAYRGTMCSVVSVFGSRSETGKSITARNMDWYGGEMNQIPRIQCVMTILYNDKKICAIDYLGFMGIITGFNNSKVFAAILDSGTGDVYSSQGKRSYTMDLRYALENTTSLDELADYMKNPSRYYAFNHDIFLSDPDVSKVLENNFSVGTYKHRKLRSSKSELNSGIKWGISDAIACVNSFIIKGNYDNHTDNKYNTKRWDNIIKTLIKCGSKVSVEELKQVISYDGGTPGTFTDSGDLYNKMTQQIIIFEPDTFNLEIYFHPSDTRDIPDDPTFIEVQALQ